MPTGIYKRIKLPWNKGLTHTEETKKKISLAHKGMTHGGMTGKTHTEETKKKISLANKGRNTGRIVSEETRKKLSLAHKGMTGKKHSEETRKKLSLSNKRKIFSEEHKINLSLANKGKKRSAYHRKRISEGHKNPSLETRKKMGDAQRGSKNHWFGIKMSAERKKAISESKKGKRNIKSQRENHWNWKGGLTPLHKTIRYSLKYIEWRKSVFEKDNFMCVFCFIRSKKEHRVNLNADHIKPFALILKENNIKNIVEAVMCTELWDINNGRTLCVNCHRKTKTYCRKVNI